MWLDPLRHRGRRVWLHFMVFQLNDRGLHKRSFSLALAVYSVSYIHAYSRCDMGVVPSIYAHRYSVYTWTLVSALERIVSNTRSWTVKDAKTKSIYTYECINEIYNILYIYLYV